MQKIRDLFLKTAIEGTRLHAFPLAPESVNNLEVLKPQKDLKKNLPQ